MTEPNDKWLDTIEKLMRKAEDPATTQAEREALADKITYLMAKFGIEQDMLKAAKDEPITAERRNITISSPYHKPKLHLAHAIAKAFGCFGVTNRDGVSIAVLGTREDIERVYMLYGSLIIQMQSALGAAEKPANVHGKSFNSSFVTGFTLTVIDRVKEAAARAKEDIRNTTTGNGMELVLVNKAQVVQNLVREIFPNLTFSTVNFASSSAAGYNAGRSAGQRADIGGTRISSQHAARRAIS